MPRPFLRRKITCALTTAALGGLLAVAPPQVGADLPPWRAAAAEGEAVPEVLTGSFWLQHHREKLMPYWELDAALGTPVGNFPSFRDRLGMPETPTPQLPRATNRGLSTLARQVYGYSLAFLLTGEERYLTWAKAGLDWITSKAYDPVHGGWFGELDADGNPVNIVGGEAVQPNDQGNKDVFDLASLGLAFGMYYNVTRDPDAEAALLAVRDLWFEKYYDAAGNRVRDSLTYDLTQPVDVLSNGDDITNVMVPATALFLPNAELLSDPARTAQFLQDLRNVTQSMIDRHRSTTQKYPWFFWGPTGRIGGYNSAGTNFGHNLKAYAMVDNASQKFPDRPWQDLAGDRATMLAAAWDPSAARWHEELRANAAIVDSSWWTHTEADQLLAAQNLRHDFRDAAQLATSAQSYLDTFLDDTFPFETFSRVLRDGTIANDRKTFFGKNMLHTHEHALIMYLHGQALTGQPATLHYAFPQAKVLSAVTKPYWFDAAGQERTVLGDVSVLPHRKHVRVEFTGIEAVPPPPYPAPADTTAPATEVTVSGTEAKAGRFLGEATATFTAVDDLVGVKEIQVLVREQEDLVPARSSIDPGAELSLSFTGGQYRVSYRAVDLLGNTAEWATVHVRVISVG